VRFGDGLAVDADLNSAAEQATGAALAGLDGAVPDLVCVFASGENAGDLASVGECVAELSGARALVGCTAHGVIGGGRGVEAVPAVSVWAAVLPGVRIRTYQLKVLRGVDGLAVLGFPDRQPDDRVALLLADPYSFPADGFVEQANQAMPGVELVGGLATGPNGAGSALL
jgi:small ligand-binding sensory domain FIST